MLAKTYHPETVCSGAMLDGHTQYPRVHRPTRIPGRWTTSRPHRRRSPKVYSGTCS